jgi:hypothetical protein
MENNNDEMRSIHDYVEESAQVEPVAEPVVEAVAEPVVEAVVEPVVETVVEPVAEAPAVEPEQALGFTATGAIGSMAADGKKKKVQPTKDLGDKVALYSTSNVRWPEVGSLYKGYNIVDKEQSEKWLTRSHVRVATPEEVKKALG